MAAVTAVHAQTPKEQVEKLKAEGKALRSQAEASFEQEQQACYRKFLVNRCIDQAKQRRLATINEARALEKEARRIDLAEKQRVAAEAASPMPPADDAPEMGALPETPAATGVSPRLDRVAEEAEREAAAAREASDAEKARKRAQVEAEAAERAEKARLDRERYDERIRQYEEKQRKTQLEE